jgi:selenide,water dikinase
LVTTVDYFTPIVDDPRDFGRIAAANSLSDIYAMGATPISALNIVGFPENKIPLEALVEILSGGASVTNEANIPIVGGHSVKSPEPFYGLSVIGQVRASQMMTNAGCRPGDRLYLTKPIGSGLITTALKNNKAPKDIVAKAIKIMTTLNRAASESAVAAGVKAATDVTGYGFLGHLMEMMVASNISAVIDFNSVPLMDGVLELSKLDIFPGGCTTNFLYVDKFVLWSDKLNPEEKKILCDPQTSGGLILSVSVEKANKLETELAKNNIPIWLVGKVVERDKWHLKITKN